MATNYQQKNSSVISKAFQRFAESKDFVLGDGLRKFMDDAMMVLEEAHEVYKEESPSFQNFHGEHDNETLAAGIAKDGDVLSMWGNRHGEDVPYNVATDMNDALLSETAGWCGSLLSGMKSGIVPPRHYNEDLEKRFYETTMAWARQTLESYFKPITPNA